MLADEERENAAGHAREDPAESERLLGEVQNALEAHDRRSEMISPEPAGRERAQRRRDRERVAREEARRLRDAGAGPGSER